MAATKYQRRLIRRATVIVRYSERTQIKLTYNRRIIITENGKILKIIANLEEYLEIPNWSVPFFE